MGHRPKADLFFGFKIACSEEWDNDEMDLWDFLELIYEKGGGHKGQFTTIQEGAQEYSSHYLTVSESHKGADWDGAAKLNDFMAREHPIARWTEELKKFCEANGVTFGEPKWLLTAYWG